MPHRVLANSIPTAHRVLKKARDQYLLTTNPAERALSVEQFAGLDPVNPPAPALPSFLNRFLKETGEVDIAIGEQGTATDTFSAARKRAGMFVSHFHQAYTSASRATSSPPPDAATTDAASATPPSPTRAMMTTWPTPSTPSSKGEADRQAADGAAFVAMSNPSAAQVAAVRTAFTTARNPKQLALQKTDREREEASVMLPEALERCKDIYDTVEYFYRKDTDDGSRRQKCERWGVAYVHEDATPPVPTPLPPNP